MSENKPKYILCPRCELNYIEESEGYCKVCKAAMGLLDPSILIPEEEELKSFVPFAKSIISARTKTFVSFASVKEKPRKPQRTPRTHG